MIYKIIAMLIIPANVFCCCTCDTIKNFCLDNCLEIQQEMLSLEEKNNYKWQREDISAEYMIYLMMCGRHSAFQDVYINSYLTN